MSQMANGILMGLESLLKTFLKTVLSQITTWFILAVFIPKMSSRVKKNEATMVDEWSQFFLSKWLRQML